MGKRCNIHGTLNCTICIQPRVLYLDEVSIDDIKRFITTKHAILWQSWFVTDPKGLEDAARWVQNLLNELYAGISGIESGGN